MISFGAYLRVTPREMVGRGGAYLVDDDLTDDAVDEAWEPAVATIDETRDSMVTVES